MPDPPPLDDLRAQVPATAAAAQLNSGQLGLLTRAAAEAMAAAAHRELTEGRLGPRKSAELAERQAELRAVLAATVGARPGEIALTHNTTDGLNIGVWGHAWRLGDRVVTTTREHAGALVPLYQLHRRCGVGVTFANIGDGAPERTLDALAAALRRPARLLVLSHVTYGTGALLPMAEIVRMAHDAGVGVLADGAQSVGAVGVDLRACGVDFYAFPGQKWLCGPEGTGGLFVRADRLDQLEPTWSGLFGMDHDGYRPNDTGGWQPVSDARRFEYSSQYRPAMAGLHASVAWLASLGWPTVHGLIGERTRYALERVAAMPATSVLTPPEATAGMVAFTVAGIDPARCVAYLADHRVLIRVIPDTGALRLCCGFFTTTEEIDRAVTLIGEFRRRHLA